MIIKRSLKLSSAWSKFQPAIFNFSEYSNQNSKNKKTYDEIVRSNTALKLALKSLTEGQHLSMSIGSQDPLRKLKNQQVDDLKKWEDTLIENRVRPSGLVPLIEFQFMTLGIVTGFLGKDVASRTTLLIEKVMEEYVDENLRILNEQELEEKDLRKSLVEVRDKGFDTTEEMIESYQIRPSDTEEQIAKVPKLVLKTLFDVTRKV